MSNVSGLEDGKFFPAQRKRQHIKKNISSIFETVQHKVYVWLLKLTTAFDREFENSQICSVYFLTKL